eukprot:31537-Pelagococcus_subviridis.AAC.2
MMIRLVCTSQRHRGEVSSQIRDAPLRRGADALDVLVQRPSRRLERLSRPLLLPRLPLRVVDVERVHRPLLRVDLDDVAVLDQADRAAGLRLRADVADDEPVRAAAEAAVGDERAVLPEAGAHDRGRRGQHLGHPGSAFRAFVSNHDHGAFERVRVLGERVEHLFFGVVHLREAFEVEAFFAGDLRHGAVGGDVTV